MNNPLAELGDVLKGVPTFQYRIHATPEQNGMRLKEAAELFDLFTAANIPFVLTNALSTRNPLYCAPSDALEMTIVVPAHSIYGVSGQGRVEIYSTVSEVYRCLYKGLGFGVVEIELPAIHILQTLGLSVETLLSFHDGQRQIPCATAEGVLFCKFMLLCKSHVMIQLTEEQLGGAEAELFDWSITNGQINLDVVASLTLRHLHGMEERFLSQWILPELKRQLDRRTRAIESAGSRTSLRIVKDD